MCILPSSVFRNQQPSLPPCRSPLTLCCLRLRAAPHEHQHSLKIPTATSDFTAPANAAAVQVPPDSMLPEYELPHMNTHQGLKPQTTLGTSHV
jgi:hypothetical protein